MPRFFVDTLSETTVLTGEDARHIGRSLRMAPGERLTLCDGTGHEAEGTIVSLSADAVTLRLGQAVASASEPGCDISLYLGLPKGDKAELVVQKAVELGAFELVLVLTERCISRPAAADAAKKVERLGRIAAEAAKQAGRGRIPAVRGLLSWGQALDELAAYDEQAFVLYEGRCPPLRSQLAPAPGRLALVTGPEGGFSPAEIEQAQARGIRTASLGPRILRCETAPIAALAALLFWLGEMD